MGFGGVQVVGYNILEVVGNVAISDEIGGKFAIVDAGEFLEKKTVADLINLLELRAIVIFIKKFMSFYGLDQIKNKIYSASGFALKCFLKNYNIFDVKPLTDERIDAFIRKSYYGGRCEVFGNPTGTAEIRHYDFMGMYAQCMQEAFPIGEGRFEFNDFDLSEPGFYDVTIMSSDFDIPVLPFKRDDGKLMFANGVMRGVYWHEELLLFKNFGGVVLKIHTAFIFKNVDVVFKRFIEEFWILKESSSNLRTIAKLYMNSLYGRLGMTKTNKKIAVVNNHKDFLKIAATDNITKFFKINECYVIEYTQGIACDSVVKVENFKKNFANVIYSSIITSKARIKLYKYMRALLAAGGRIFYCDTDSVFVSFIEVPSMCWDNIHEFTRKIQDAVFILPKCYALQYADGGEEVVCKGVGGDAFAFKDLKKNFYARRGGLGHYAKRTLRKNFKLEERLVYMNILGLPYDKRKFCKKKVSTTPLTYQEGFFI